MAENTVERILRERATLPTVALVPRYRKQDVIELGGFSKYLKAAASSPEDWWHGIHFMNSLTGLYGEQRQRNAKVDLGLMKSMLLQLGKQLPEIYKVLTILLQFAVSKKPLAEMVINNVNWQAVAANIDRQAVIDELENILGSVDKAALGEFLVDAALKRQARKGGRKFTVYAASGGMIPRRKMPKKLKKTLDVSNTVIIIIGSAWRYLIETRNKSRTLLGPYFAYTSGDFRSGIDARTEYRLGQVLKNLDLKIDPSFKSDIEGTLSAVSSVLNTATVKLANQ